MEDECVELKNINYQTMLLNKKVAEKPRAQNNVCEVSEFLKREKTRDKNLPWTKLEKATNHANRIGLKVHAGHGLTFKSAHQVSKIKDITEFNIGHFIVAESVFIGLKNTIKKFKRLINK